MCTTYEFSIARGQLFFLNKSHVLLVMEVLSHGGNAVTYKLNKLQKHKSSIFKLS